MWRTVILQVWLRITVKAMNLHFKTTYIFLYGKGNKSKLVRVDLWNFYRRKDDKSKILEVGRSIKYCIKTWCSGNEFLHSRGQNAFLPSGIFIYSFVCLTQWLCFCHSVLSLPLFSFSVVYVQAKRTGTGTKRVRDLEKENENNMV